jgi:TRAP-type C4-dicarboxylate transport system substrate-binding protein
MEGNPMSYVSKIAAAGVLALGLTSSGALAADPVNLRLTSYLPPEHFANKLIIQPLIAKIGEYSNGSLKVQNFPGGQLANAPGTLNAVKSGIANMGLVGIGYVGETMPMSTIIELPGAFDDLAKGHAAYAEVVERKLTTAEFLPNGVRPIMVTALPQTQLVFAKAVEINSLADLKGLKIRVPHATAGSAIAALGMVPVQMPVSDLYLALERGTVDGAVLLLASVPSYKLNEVTKAATTNLAMGSIAFTVVINERDWKKLSPELQQAVLRAGRESGAGSVVTLNKVNAGSQAKLSEGGMKMLKVGDGVRQEIAKAMASIGDSWVKDVSKRNPMAADVAAEYRKLAGAN